MTQVSSQLSIAGTDDPVVAASQVARLAGAVKTLTRAAYDLAVSAERTRITNNITGIYANGEQIHILGEAGYRTWSLAAGGTNAANAAGSHARTVVLAAGKSFVLPNDANTATLAAGAPANSSGATGDLVLDGADGVVRIKGVSIWAAGGNSSPAIPPLAFAATTFDSSNRITAYTLGGEAHTVAYTSATTFIVTGPRGSRSGTLNGGAQLIALA